jgi:poly(A) polymerase
MNHVTGDWLQDQATQVVFNLLLSNGFQAYVVGGCVRNALLNHPVADVDFATNARPEQVASLAQKAGLKTIPTGVDHGTITIVVMENAFEITTYRKDIETDGRHAVIAYADRFEVDAHRRDFTMNALYADKNGQIFDPLDGLTDIAAKHVRFIDNAKDRIREDYLRILRFFRFHAWFGDPEGGINVEALAAIGELADGLPSLSKERIGSEIRKLLLAPDPAPSVASMSHCGALHRVLPGASAAALAVLVHLEGSISITPNWIRRLACLGGEGQVENLRLSKSDARKLRLYLENIGTPTQLPELAYRHGAEAAINICLLRGALLGNPLADDLVKRAATAAAQVFPVKARDITTGEVGPDLGAKLKHLEAEWIASQFTKTRAALLA